MIAVKSMAGLSARRAREVLEREGFAPWVDPDCPQGVYFHWNGEPHYLQVDEADPEFLLLCVGYRLEEEARRDELALHRDAGAAQGRAKVVKVILAPGLEYVTFQAELFLVGQQLTRALLHRCLGALRAASDDFFGEALDEAPRALA
jgi:hypothetical protein